MESHTGGSGKSMQWSESDVQFMTRALEVAETGRGRVSPNPLVGCVLVKDDQIIAEGWHDHLGGLHAEQMAIHDAEQKGHSPNGSTAYITLEPCNHFGRTPPCTQALMWAGIKKAIQLIQLLVITSVQWFCSQSYVGLGYSTISKRKSISHPRD